MAVILDVKPGSESAEVDRVASLEFRRYEKAGRAEPGSGFRGMRASPTNVLDIVRGHSAVARCPRQTSLLGQLHEALNSHYRIRRAAQSYCLWPKRFTYLHDVVHAAEIAQPSQKRVSHPRCRQGHSQHFEARAESFRGVCCGFAASSVRRSKTSAGHSHDNQASRCSPPCASVAQDTLRAWA